MKKRLFSLVLALCLCMGLAVPALAAEEDRVYEEDYFRVTNMVSTGDATLFMGVLITCDAPAVITLLKPIEDFSVYKEGGDDALPYTKESTYTGYTGKTIFDVGTTITLTEPGEYTLYCMGDTEDTLKEAPASSHNKGSGVYGMYQVDIRAASAPVDSKPTGSTVPSETSFTDVKPSDYFADAVQWAVEKNITAGTSAATFSPSATCTKAQILTFLWRANGSPEPEADNPFTDIKPADYYYKAALWAAEKGLVSGSAFGGGTDCTRAMTVEYLWKAAGNPTAAAEAGFDDVPSTADYAQAVAWAVEKGITSGTGNHNFSPAATCTRGQIVTFLYRAMAQ